MKNFDIGRARITCGLCGKPIDNDQQVASVHVTRRNGGGRSVEIHALCLKPHLHKAEFGNFIDDAATVDQRQQIWDRSKSGER
jgi:hypothetical protein